MIYGSACSGIEAATEAWRGLGWKCAFVAEVEPFCCFLLNQRYGASRPQYMPDPEALLITEDEMNERKNNIRVVRELPETTALPSLGDMMQADPSKWKGKIDVLVGGTPCQAFSVAGLRRSLNDSRGNLTLRFVEWIDAIGPRYVVWENVPGVLNTSDNAFGCFLGALVGADSALVPPKGLRWTNTGVVDGPKRSASWRILDAQYFGVAQRRERVFVVASARDAAHPAEIIFEREGVQRHSPPSREEGKMPAGRLAARTTVAFGGNNTSGPIDVAAGLNAKGGGGPHGL